MESSPSCAEQISISPNSRSDSSTLRIRFESFCSEEHFYDKPVRTKPLARRTLRVGIDETFPYLN